MADRVREPSRDGLWVHLPTGWIVDTDAGTVYGVRQGSIGRKLGGLDHRGTMRVIRRHTDGIARSWRVHDIVWEVAHDQRVPEHHIVTHVNGDKADCRAGNLLLERRHTLTDDQAAIIRESTDSTRATAVQIGVNPGSISRIRTGQSHKHSKRKD